MVAKPVFIVGMQRSGTNYLYWNLEKDNNVEGYNEDNPAAFERFVLKSLENTKQLIDSSKSKVILFKSITNVLRADALLSVDPDAKILWIMRDVSEVVRSHEKTFGEDGIKTVVKALDGIRLKQNAFFADWKGKYPQSCVSNIEVQNLVSSCADRYLSMCTTDYDRAAIYWFLLNYMYFIFGFEQSTQVKVVQYDRLVSDPHKEFKSIGNFCGIPDFSFSIEPVKPKARTEEQISDSILLLCRLVKRSIDQAELIKWKEKLE